VTTTAFLLTRHWRDTPQGIVLEFWCASDDGALCIEITQQEAVFFIAREELQRAAPLLQRFAHRVGDAALKNFQGAPVIPVYCKNFRHARDAERQLSEVGISVWESDIRPHERFLMERFITGGLTVSGPAQRLASGHRKFTNPRLQSADIQPHLRWVSLDIETSFVADELFSIAVFAQPDLRRVFMVGGDDFDEPSLHITACESERDCLQRFLSWLADYDPDVIVGWNLVQFDLWVLEQLCRRMRVNFALGRNGEKPHWREEDDGNRRFVQVPGRQILDGIEVLKAATFSFPSYSLENVARELLGEGKLLSSGHRADEIAELFQHDKVQLARYNLKDCELVWDIFVQAKLLAFAIERTHLTGLLLDRIGGSVASFEYAYLPKLHRKGYVAPNLGELKSGMMSPGGYVLDSQPGIFRNVLVLDFKSLYPSIIRTFRIDPYGFWYAQHNELEADAVVPGFRGAVFAKREHLLPDIIERLWQARDKAKAENNQPLSQAIKIIMNSFYGVLGSPGCRFYDPRVCSSITLRGHDIIQQSKEWIEGRDYTVIYGDTDSVFVWVGNERPEHEAIEIGKQLAAELNRRWREKLADEYGIDSALEIEFETHYVQFLMPTVRNSEQGSKKRYAGLVRRDDELQLVFKGLENVRTDWTVLAKQFQQEVYRRVFYGEPVEAYIRETTDAVLNGERDADLVYRKRLRRKLADYQKNVPPHVQAARKLEQWQQVRLGRGDWISYLITVNGAEPQSARRSPIDYQHYIDRQLAPVADSVLQFIDLSFADITAPQLHLFAD